MKRLFIVLSVFLLSSCGENLEERVVTRYPNGNPIDVLYYKNNQPVMEARFLPNGEKEMECEMQNGLKHGKLVQWYPNNKKWIEETYENGRKNGEFTVWNINGEKSYEGSYQKDKPSGTWYFYDANGNRISQQEYN